jgi:hypothetical protein
MEILTFQKKMGEGSEVIDMDIGSYTQNILKTVLLRKATKN